MKRIILLFAVLIIFSIPLSAAFESKVIYNQGMEAFRSGNYSSAELLFRKTLENDDDYRDRAWFYLSRTIYHQNKYKAAIYEFNSFLTKCRTESLRIESRFWMGESYYQLNDFLKAIEEYNRFLEKSEDPSLIITARDRIATIYFNQQRYEESVIEWEKSLKASADMDQNAQIVIKIGTALFKNGEFDKSLERLLPLLSARINSRNKAEIRLLAGRIYQQQNDHRKALTAFNAVPKELTETYPFYDVYYFRALSYIDLERESQARTELELFKLIGKKSEFYNAGMFELGRILLNSNKPLAGIEILQTIWETAADKDLSVKSAILIAQTYMDNDPGKSIQYLEKFKTTTDDDQSKTILLMLGRAYVKTENYDKAETVLKLFAEKFPYDQNMDEINFMKGVVLLQRGELDAALEIFNSIKKDNPFSKFINDTDYYMALVSYKKEKLDEAAALLRTYTVKKDINKLFEARLLLAEIYLTTGDLKRAEKEVIIIVNNYPKFVNVDKMLFFLAEKMFEKNINTSQIYFNMLQNKYPDSEYAAMVNLIYGNKFYQKNDFEKAIFYYEKYLNTASEKDRGTAYYNLLVSNYKLKRYGRVIEIVNSIKVPLLDEAQWKEIPLLKARSFYNQKNYEQVYNLLKWDDYKKFADDDIKMLVDSTIRTGDIKTASAMIDGLNDREKLQSEMLLQLASYYKDNKRIDESKNIYNAILLSGAEESIKEKARLSLAEIYAESGNYELSLNLLNQVEMKENVAERDCLIIINYFYSGKEKRGAEITDSRLKYILDTGFTEQVLLLNMVYHFNQKNINLFNEYVKLLKPYKQNTDYINYLSGKLYYETGNYKLSYLSFYKLSLADNAFSTEINYYLGKLTLLNNNNRSGAITYYKKVLNDENNKNEYVQKAKIELSLIYNELKDGNSSVDLLNGLIAGNDKGRFRIQAENLLEQFAAGQ